MKSKRFVVTFLLATQDRTEISDIYSVLCSKFSPEQIFYNKQDNIILPFDNVEAPAKVKNYIQNETEINC